MEESKIAELHAVRSRKICRFFKLGGCVYGDKCWESHGKKISKPNRDGEGRKIFRTQDGREFVWKVKSQAK